MNNSTQSLYIPQPIIANEQPKMEEVPKYLEQESIVTYTDAEYEQYLQNKDWTKSATDSMMKYAKEYGMCWEVVYDRLIAYNDFHLSLDAVIERYLSITLKLSQVRFSQRCPNTEFVHPYDFYPFDRSL